MANLQFNLFIPLTHLYSQWPYDVGKVKGVSSPHGCRHSGTFHKSVWSQGFLSPDLLRAFRSGRPVWWPAQHWVLEVWYFECSCHSMKLNSLYLFIGHWVSCSEKWLLISFACCYCWLSALFMLNCGGSLCEDSNSLLVMCVLVTLS